MSRVEVDEDGNKFHFNAQGYLHREDGPAAERLNGDKSWYLNGERHRIDGPAVEWANGCKCWYSNNQLHRVDGPAIERPNGSKSWFLNDKLHRVDGPAVECFNGYKYWYIEGQEYTEEQFYVEIAKRHGCDLSTFPQLAYDYCQDNQLIDTHC